jgi:hypothetical protein
VCNPSVRVSPAAAAAAAVAAKSCCSCVSVPACLCLSGATMTVRMLMLCAVQLWRLNFDLLGAMRMWVRMDAGICVRWLRRAVGAWLLVGVVDAACIIHKSFKAVTVQGLMVGCNTCS